MERPFILWTKQDVAAIRAKMDTQAWARDEAERMRQTTGWGDTYRNLFFHVVLGDEKAGASERDQLLSFIDAPVDPREWSNHYLTALRYDVLQSVSAAFVLDAEGVRAFEGGQRYPRLYRASADGAQRDEIDPGVFEAFHPTFHKRQEDAPAVLEEGGTHPHGSRSVFEYRFTEDWVWIRAKLDGRLTYDWAPAGRRGASDDVLVLIGTDGSALEIKAPRRFAGVVSARFARAAGSACGRATFYPPNSEFRNGAVWQEAAKPMGFTFCTEAEFPELRRRWAERGADADVTG